MASSIAVRGAEETDAVSPESDFARDVIAGLSAPHKSLPSKYFYDDPGAALFEAICALPEYYPTRMEIALLKAIAPRLAAAIPPGAALIEYGSGSSLKTQILLDAAPQIGVYIPIDINQGALAKAASAIRSRYPNLTVAPLVADFTAPLSLPPLAASAKVGFFPGSTIGNFTPDARTAFLNAAREQLGPEGLFILGADMVKNEAIVVAAYDDAAGVTAAFNLNLLRRINRELDGDADLDAFEHRARWNATESRLEMHLVSCRRQTIRAAGAAFTVSAGETIHTENCYKFAPWQIDAFARQCGWKTVDSWASEAPAFAISLLKAA